MSGGDLALLLHDIAVAKLPPEKRRGLAVEAISRADTDQALRAALAALLWVAEERAGRFPAASPEPPAESGNIVLFPGARR